MGPKPLMAQYRRIKSAHPDAIVLFQVGDFYELFYKDAEEAAALLDLALTSREKESGTPVPMCGVPVRAVEGYLARLIKLGRNVAVCDQMEPPGPGKKKLEEVSKEKTARPSLRIVKS